MKKLTVEQQLYFIEYCLEYYKSIKNPHTNTAGICHLFQEWYNDEFKVEYDYDYTMPIVFPEMWKEIEILKSKRMGAWAWNVYDTNSRINYLAERKDLLNRYRTIAVESIISS